MQRNCERAEQKIFTWVLNAHSRIGFAETPAREPCAWYYFFAKKKERRSVCFVVRLSRVFSPSLCFAQGIVRRGEKTSELVWAVQIEEKKQGAFYSALLCVWLWKYLRTLRFCSLVGLLPFATTILLLWELPERVRITDYPEYISLIHSIYSRYFSHNSRRKHNLAELVSRPSVCVLCVALWNNAHKLQAHHYFVSLKVKRQSKKMYIHETTKLVWRVFFNKMHNSNNNLFKWQPTLSLDRAISFRK